MNDKESNNTIDIYTLNFIVLEKNFCEIGGVEAVVKAINTHIDSPDVCQWGCFILRNIADNGKQYQQ